MQPDNSVQQTLRPRHPGMTGADDRIPRTIKELPQRIEGRLSDIWINSGPTVATARLGPGPGRYAADLWLIEGNPFPWRVRTDQQGVHRFGDEAEAVAFFLERLCQAAHGPA
jgi:hypothetical protein